MSQVLTDLSPLSLFPPSLLPPVPYQQNPYTPGSSSTVIQCYRCGDTCKGEVVRVQSNHFHIRCFTCQGRMVPEELVARLAHGHGCSLESKRLGMDLPGPLRCGHVPGGGSFPTVVDVARCRWKGGVMELSQCRQCLCLMSELVGCEQG